MALSILDDIKSVTELKRNASSLLQQVHATKRPVVLTVNGKAEAVLMDAGEYEKFMSAFQLLKLLAPAEDDIRHGRVKEAKQFFKEFRRDKKI